MPNLGRFTLARRGFQRVLHQGKQDVLNAQSIDRHIRQIRLRRERELGAARPRQQLENRHELADHVADLTFDVPVRLPVEQTADAADALPGIQRFLADVLQDLGGRLNHGLRPIEHALGGLGERRNRADRLIELVRDAAGHFLQRRNARDLQQPLQQQRCLFGVCASLVDSVTTVPISRRNHVTPSLAASMPHAAVLTPEGSTERLVPVP